MIKWLQKSAKMRNMDKKIGDAQVWSMRMPRLANEKNLTPERKRRCMNQDIITSTFTAPRLQHQSCDEETKESHGAASDNVVCLAGAA
jgi:hypothetical protein